MGVQSSWTASSMRSVSRRSYMMYRHKQVPWFTVYRHRRITKISFATAKLPREARTVASWYHGTCVQGSLITLSPGLCDVRSAFLSLEVG